MLPAVQLGFDSLRVRVGAELLAGFLGNQKQRVVLSVGDLELVGAERADLFCGGVRVDHQRFGRAAQARLLQRHPEIVLERNELRFRNLQNEALMKRSSRKSTCSYRDVTCRCYTRGCCSTTSSMR